MALLCSLPAAVCVFCGAVENSLLCPSPDPTPAAISLPGCLSCVPLHGTTRTRVLCNYFLEEAPLSTHELLETARGPRAAEDEQVEEDFFAALDEGEESEGDVVDEGGESGGESGDDPEAVSTAPDLLLPPEAARTPYALPF